MNRLKGTVVGAAGLIAILTLASRLMGLVRKLAQSWAVSDGQVATAYDTANTVPNVLFEIAAGGALAGAVIPLVSRFLARKLHAEASHVLSALMTWLLTLSLPLVLIVVVFANPVVSLLLGGGIDPAIVDLAATMLRVFAIQIPLYGLSVILTGGLQARKSFVLPALAPLLSSIVVIGAFVVYAMTYGPQVTASELTIQGTYILAWGTTAGVIVFSLPQLIPVMRHYRIRPTWSFPGESGKQTVRLASAGLAALVAQQLAIIAIMYTANSLGNVGTYAAFNYAYAIFMVPYAVLAVPIATATFPRISEAVELEDSDRLATLVSRSTRLVLAMGMVAGALLLVLARPAQIVLELGNPIAGMDTAMRYMAVGLIGFSLIYHGARVLYALDAGRRVVVVNSLAWGSVVLVLIIAHVSGVSDRTPTLMWIGAAMSIGLSVGALAVIANIRTLVGDAATSGYLKTAGLLMVALGMFGTLSWFVVSWIIGAMNETILGAFVAAAVGAVIIVGASLATLRFADPTTLRGLSSAT